MINWYYMVVLAGVLLVWLLYREWIRKKRSRLFGRLLASLLVVSSLLLMAYPYPGKKTIADLKKVIILTDGFMKDSVDDFLQRSDAAIPVYANDPELQYKGNTPKLVAGWRTFAAKHEADTLHVFGNGFDEETLTALDNHPIVFHAPAPRPAITQIYWKQSLETGAQLIVQGYYENNSVKKIKILLAAFGAVRDTAFVDAGVSAVFQLQTIPLHTGRAVYNLIVLSGNDTLQQEPVPVEVNTTVPLQLLIISSAPDFDNTYLKNNLSRQGFQVTLSTTVSTNKADKQFLNTAAEQGGPRLTALYVSKFDVVIADQEALQKMSGTELAALRSAIAGKGTGLLVKMEAQKNTTAFYARFFPVKTVQQDREVFRWLQGAAGDSSRYKIKISEPLSIVYQPGQQIILQDAQSNIYAAAVLYGSGKIIASTLQNTFSMALAGNKNSWQQLWALLLNKASRKIYPQEVWRGNPVIAFQNNPVQMLMETADSTATQAFTGSTGIYLAQDGALSFVRKGMYWPVATGWQALPQINTASGSWYVYKKGDWQQLMDYQHANATKKYMASHPFTISTEVPVGGSGFMANIRLWLLVVFLAACIFLWVEQKAG